MSAHCTAHGAAATTTCKRCGIFLCQSCARQLDAHQYCASCVALPEVDYLEEYRLRFYGRRREGYGWLFGFSGALSLLMTAGASLAALSAKTGDSLVAIGVSLVLTITQLGWFFRQRWARPALLGVVVLLAVGVVAAAGPAPLLAFLMPIAIVGTAYGNVRSKLFFRLNVTREELRKDWAVYHDNTIARTARSLSFLGLVLWPVAPIAVVLGVIGLRRVNPLSTPPVGNRGAALTAIVAGGIGCLFGVLFFVAAMLNQR